LKYPARTACGRGGPTRDAAERRITELYTKAADQLGSDEAPVPLAGLDAKERLALRYRPRK